MQLKEDKFIKHSFVILLSLHFVLWILIPSFRQSVPIDSIEAIAWGGNFMWGYDKNPLLPGLLARLFFDIFETEKAIYLLSQICVLLALIYTYFTAKIFLSKYKAFLATMLMEGIVYYSFTTPQFNDNVLSLPLWIMCAYFFIKAVQENKIQHWLLWGIIIGLNFLNKYSCVFLFAGIFFYSVFTSHGRIQLKRYGFWLGVSLGLLIILPHIYWLWKYDFTVLKYVVERHEYMTDYAVLNCILSPIRFFGGQLLYTSLALAIYFAVNIREIKYSKANLKNDDSLLLIFLGILPIFLFALYGFLKGIILATMWGTPMSYMLTIMILKFFPCEITYKKARIIVFLCYFVMLSFAALMFSFVMATDNPRYNFDGKEFAKKIDSLWLNETGINKQLEYLGGDIWYCGFVNAYSNFKTNLMLRMNDSPNPFFDMDIVKNKGALLLNPNESETERIRTLCGNTNTIKYGELSFETKNILDNKVLNKVRYVIVFPLSRGTL